MMNVFQSLPEARRSTLVIGAGLTAIFIIIGFIFPSSTASLDREVLSSFYRIRGEHSADSSVVLLTLDNNDLTALGGLPLKRSYYALIIDMLTVLDVRAIGVDLAFPTPDRDHPEYDEVFSSVVKRSERVVLGTYFRQTGKNISSIAPMNFPPQSIYQFPSRQTQYWIQGNEAELPFPALSNAAISIGHTNLLEHSKLPMFIQISTSQVASLGLELFRVGNAIDKNALINNGDYLSIDGSRRQWRIPLSPEGTVALNIPGQFQTFQHFSALDMLKRFDASRTNGSIDAVLSALKGKFVILAIVAEGRSAFIETPFEAQFSASGIHAIVIDNILQHRFLVTAPVWLTTLLILFVGTGCTMAFTLKGETIGTLITAGLVILLAITAVLAFIQLYVILPIGLAVVTAVLCGVTLFFQHHLATRRKLHSVAAERDEVRSALHAREVALRDLELRLVHAEKRSGPSAEDERAILEIEIERYKQEIAYFKQLAADVQPAAEKGTAGFSSITQQDFQGIIFGSGSPMARIVEMVQKVAASDATVLLLGESGTGKELVARALHERSPRSGKPFVAVNCGALPENLLESELFGYERGAFTGAVKSKPGRFELANGGTIFLDEIGDIPDAFQVKLLRVLQDRSFERVGGTETLKVDVRVIAATNRDLKTAVREKRFREDLFYRINVFPIELPPLRERATDIPLLLNYFLQRSSATIQCSATAADLLSHYHWPGNVRELESVITRSVLLAEADGRTLIRQKDLPPEIVSARTKSGTDIEDQILALLREKGFSRNAISETADDLGGLNRGTVAEYFRGLCFKVFVESSYDLHTAVDRISCSQVPEIRERSQKKLTEYLSNAVEFADGRFPLEEVCQRSKPKYKNLPQRYHPFLDNLITTYHEGRWKL